MQAMFALSDTQAQLQDSLGRWLADTVPFSRRAALLATPDAVLQIGRASCRERVLQVV